MKVQSLRWQRQRRKSSIISEEEHAACVAWMHTRTRSRRGRAGIGEGALNIRSFPELRTMSVRDRHINGAWTYIPYTTATALLVNASTPGSASLLRSIPPSVRYTGPLFTTTVPSIFSPPHPVRPRQTHAPMQLESRRRRVAERWRSRVRVRVASIARETTRGECSGVRADWRRKQMTGPSAETVGRCHVCQIHCRWVRVSGKGLEKCAGKVDATGWRNAPCSVSIGGTATSRRCG
jgi:hypothetical protein